MRVLVPFLALATACGNGTDPAPDAGAIPMSPAQPGLLTEAEFKALHVLKEGEAPALTGQVIDLAGGRAYLSLPVGEPPFPGVIVIHEWYGLNDHVEHWADRLAADGYAALAVDLYGGTVATNSDEAMAAMKAVDPARAEATLAAAHAFLAEDARVRATRRGVIGWCFGGGWSLRHAIAHDGVDAAVMYYGRLESDQDALRRIEAPILGIFGKRDAGIPVDSVEVFSDALVRQGKSVEIRLYDAGHAFANPSGANYDEGAASDAWAQVRRFFDVWLRG